MPSGYWIVRVDVTEQGHFKAYAAANADPLEKLAPGSFVHAAPP